jgi:inosine/xanthosine triphosphate pyrophosphatase family protein
MEKEFNLNKLKEDYKILQERYNLLSFEKLNADFQIEKIAEYETDFVLREIREAITTKLINYLRFIESLINPSNGPMFMFAVIKTLDTKQKEKLSELYKKMAKADIDLIELDLEYSEEKEAEAIKKYFDMWQEIKKELLGILDVIKKNWDAKIEDSGKGYFG